MERDKRLYIGSKVELMMEEISFIVRDSSVVIFMAERL